MKRIKRKPVSQYFTTTVIENFLDTGRSLTLSWDYGDRYPTEAERQATINHAIKLQGEL